MSITHSIACRDCREYLWIGQGKTIYYEEKETMEYLKAFLYKHYGFGHTLIFTANDNELLNFYDDFTEKYDLEKTIEQRQNKESE